MPGDVKRNWRGKKQENTIQDNLYVIELRSANDTAFNYKRLITIQNTDIWNTTI